MCDEILQSVPAKKYVTRDLDLTASIKNNRHCSANKHG